MILGVDIGGTKTLAVALGSGGEVLASARRPTIPGPTGVVESVRDVLADLVGVAPHRLPGVVGRGGEEAPTTIGVGVPGFVAGDGTITQAVNLGVTRLELGARLEQELDVPVMVENDVKASALGAVAQLDAWEASLTFLNFGTGVSSATVIRGKVLRGVANAAGEIGHVPVDLGGDACPCGQRGCLELRAGGAAILRRLGELRTPRTLAELFPATTTGGESPDDVEEQSTARFEPDTRLEPDALALRESVLAAAAHAVTTSAVMYGSDLIALSGGVLAHAPHLLSHIEARLRSQAATSPFLNELNVVARVRTLPASWPVAAAGAALAGSLRRETPDALRGIASHLPSVHT